MSEIKLLNCPFCGGEAELNKNYKVKMYSVQCKDCKCMTTFQFDFGEGEEISKNKAVEIWNTRKPMERILERLEDLEKYTEQKAIDVSMSEGHTLDFEFYSGKKEGVTISIEICKEEGGIE